MATILIVDDDTDSRQLYALILGRAGYQTIMAHHGIHALEILASQTPDLILLDRMMPDMGGMECLQKIRQNPETQNLPVIMLMGLEIEIWVKALELGADDILSIPFQAETLLDRVRKLLSPSG